MFTAFTPFTYLPPGSMDANSPPVKPALHPEHISELNGLKICANNIIR